VFAALSRVLAAGLAVAAASPALARDRPGTPNDVYAARCPDSVRPNVGPGDICVQLHNTATESVKFAAEWTINGELQNDPVGAKLHVTCLNSFLVPNLHCNAAIAMGYPEQMAMLASVTVPQGIRFSGLAYDVQYCFRFEAIDADGVVSEIWSERVCVQTPPPPPLPQAPTNVHATLLPAESGIGVPGPEKPPRLLIEWEADDAAVGWYLVQRFDKVWAPGRELERGQIGPALNTSHDEIIQTTPQDVAAHPFGAQFRVCAENATGEACSAPASSSNWTGTVERPNPGATGIEHPNAGEQDTNRPVPTTLPTGADQVGRPGGGFGTGMSGQNNGHSSACAPGYVWRVARAEDFVCVTPAARGRIRQENTQGPRHVIPTGAYGPNTCAAGYVWREAYQGDVVCVTPAARAIARQENADGPSHTADKDEVFRAPR
jgi:hypothetical protein